MNRFNPTEIFEFAIKIEEDGRRFYEKSASVIKDEKVKSLLMFLADEEIKHKETFEKILSSFESFEPAESYNEEYFAYLKAYVDNLIFKYLESPDPEKLTNVFTVLEYALAKEMDTILYYHEMKNLVLPENSRHFVDRIIDEERKHVVMIKKMINEL